MDYKRTCRICLVTDVKLYNMCKYGLKTPFEYLTGLKMEESHKNLEQVCSYCGTLLEKFYKFRERCVYTQQLLLSASNLVTPNTTRSIKTITHPYVTNLIDNIDIPTPVVNNEPTNITSNDGLFDTDNDATIKSDEELESDEEPLSAKVSNTKKNGKISKKSEVSAKDEYDNCIDVIVLSKEEQMKEVLDRKLSDNYESSMYRCEVCFKGYKKERTYKNHMAQHDMSAGSLSCDVCHIRRPDQRALNAHIQVTHERKYICKLCGHTSRISYKAREHAAWHRGRVFRCHCGRTFTRSTSYLTHVRTRHGSRRCDQCGAACIGARGLTLHRKRAHRGLVETDQCYRCNDCGESFDTKHSLEAHIQAIVDGVCRKYSSCEQCGDSFTSDSDLKEHLKSTHIKENMRNCAQCSRSFASERSLSDHHRREHSANVRARARKRAMCEICGHICNSKSALIYHQRTHTGEKPHECVACHKRFTVLERLQIHLRTHTGERPFQCGSCPKAFKQKAALNRHNRIHTGAKPYACPQCGKTFSQSNSMKQHCAGVHMKHYLYARHKRTDAHVE